MLNTAINIEQVVSIAEYIGSTPARVAQVLEHPGVSAEAKLLLLSLTASKTVN
jgi:hypothetical protein